MERKQMRLKDRRSFLTGAGAYGALLVGASLPLESRALDAQEEPVDAANACVVQEKMKQLFGSVWVNANPAAVRAVLRIDIANPPAYKLTQLRKDALERAQR